VIAYARRLVSRQYQVRREDAEDVVAEALLDFVRASRRRIVCSDGLFLVIVRRRACDFWRNRRHDLPLGAAETVACRLNVDSLMERSLRDCLLGINTSRSRLYRRRLLAVTRGILAGATFAEACRASRIPRGSQGRYRKSLQEFLEAGISPSRAPFLAPSRRAAGGELANGTEASPPSPRGSAGSRATGPERRGDRLVEAAGASASS
jgi:hypothetical protein